MNWKYFYSSVKGTSHIASNTAKQDNCKSLLLTLNDKNYLVCAVADGAGSAKYSDLSSNFICKLFIAKTKQWLEKESLESLTREVITEWFTYFQKVLNRAVSLYKLESIRDFATTLLFAVLSENFNVFVQIGDGIIAAGTENDLDCVFLPQNGEFINTTHFATESTAQKIFMFKTVENSIERLAMHTDGIEQIAFDFKAQKPFMAFFKPFYLAVEKLENYGHDETLSKQLGMFLDSDRVNKKTDDDKTLFIASSLRTPVIVENMECKDEQQ